MVHCIQSGQALPVDSSDRHGDRIWINHGAVSIIICKCKPASHIRWANSEYQFWWCVVFFFCCFCLHSLSHLWSQNDDLLWLSLPRWCSCWQKKDLRCTICESFGNYLNVFVYTAVSSFYSIYAFTTKNTMILFTPPPTDKRGCVCAFYLFFSLSIFFLLFLFSPFHVQSITNELRTSIVKCKRRYRK